MAGDVAYAGKSDAVNEEQMQRLAYLIVTEFWKQLAVIVALLILGSAVIFSVVFLLAFLWAGFTGQWTNPLHE